jgi:hypothetical protein
MYIQTMKNCAIFIAVFSILGVAYYKGRVDKENEQTIALVKQNQKIQQSLYKANNQKAVDIQVSASQKIEEVKRNANTTDDVTISAKWLCYYAGKVCPTTLSK